MFLIYLNVSVFRSSSLYNWVSSQHFCELLWTPTIFIFPWTQSIYRGRSLTHPLFFSRTPRWGIDGRAALKEMCKWVQTTGHSQASFPQWLDQDLLPCNELFITLHSSPPFHLISPHLLSIRRGSSSLTAPLNNNAGNKLEQTWRCDRLTIWREKGRSSRFKVSSY